MRETVTVGDHRWSATLVHGTDDQGRPLWRLERYEIPPERRELGEAETARRCALLGEWAATIASYNDGRRYLADCGYVPEKPGELAPNLNLLRDPEDRRNYERLKFKNYADVQAIEAKVKFEGFLD